MSDVVNNQDQSRPPANDFESDVLARWRRHTGNTNKPFLPPAEEWDVFDHLMKAYRRPGHRRGVYEIARAFMEAVSASRHAGNIGPEHLRLVKSDRPYVLRLIDKRGYPANTVQPPACDHPELWTWKGKPLYFVSHPYGINASEVAQLDAFCKGHGLAFTISPDSWYFHGWTFRIEIFVPAFEEEYRLACRAHEESERASIVQSSPPPPNNLTSGGAEPVPR